MKHEQQRTLAVTECLLFALRPLEGSAEPLRLELFNQLVEGVRFKLRVLATITALNNLKSASFS